MILRHVIAFRPQGHDVGHVEIISTFTVFYVPVEPSSSVLIPHDLRYNAVLHYMKHVISLCISSTDERKKNENVTSNSHLLYTGQETMSDITEFLGFVSVPHLFEPRTQRHSIHVQYTVQVDGHKVGRPDIGQITCVVRVR